MRDTRKSADYFDRYIGYERSRIENKLEKIAVTNDQTKISRIQKNLLLFRMNLLIASFSAGESKDALGRLLNEACSTATEVKQLTYSDALILSSVAIILNNHLGIQRVIETHQSVYESDKLLLGFSSFIERGRAEWRGSYRFSNVYSGIDAVLSAENSKLKETALMAYLNEWYEMNKDCAWYETLDDPNDVYYGYWCFEAGALAKIFRLDEQSLAQNEYYPFL